MLGDGEYNFFPRKVVWESYGKSRFNPTIFKGIRQANQTLHAFIPVKTLTEAERIQMELSEKTKSELSLIIKNEKNHEPGTTQQNQKKLSNIMKKTPDRFLTIKTPHNRSLAPLRVTGLIEQPIPRQRL